MNRLRLYTVPEAPKVQLVRRRPKRRRLSVKQWIVLWNDALEGGHFLEWERAEKGLQRACRREARKEIERRGRRLEARRGTMMLVMGGAALKQKPANCGIGV